MHRAASYLGARFAPKVKKAIVEAYVLTPTDAATVVAALPIDASDYYYSACVSVLDGLRAIESGFYTWSTVKLYYAVFYALRAMLAWDGVAVFRPDEAVFRVAATAGQSPQWLSGSGSHKTMLNCFRAVKPLHPILSQDIELVDGLEWMVEKREHANYKMPRFAEPTPPDHYSQIVRLGVRQALAAYFDPSSAFLAFDKDHAIVSFPIAVLVAAGDMAKRHGKVPAEIAEMEFIAKKCRERGGALAPFVTFIRSTVR